MEFFGSRLVWAPLTNIAHPDIQVGDDSSDDESTAKHNQDHQSAVSALDGLPNDMAYSQ